MSFLRFPAWQRSLRSSLLDFDLPLFYTPKTAIATKKTAICCQLCSHSLFGGDLPAPLKTDRWSPQAEVLSHEFRELTRRGLKTHADSCKFAAREESTKLIPSKSRIKGQ
jgi:hypothetical protein